MRESLRKNKKGILIMLCSAVCACIGQLLWKISADVGVWMAFGGFVFYGMGALFMLIAYKFGKVSVLQPMLSVNYVLSLILGAAILKETVTTSKIAGIFLIMIGVICIGGGDRDD